MTHRKMSLTLAIIMMAISLFYLVNSFSLRTDGTYPKIVLAAILVLGVIVIWQDLRDMKKEKERPHHQISEAELTTEEKAILYAEEHEEKASWKDILLVMLVAFGSLILWKPITFMLAAAIGILILSFYKKQPVVRSVLVAVCSVLVLQLIFVNIFTIPLPSPSWWPYF